MNTPSRSSRSAGQALALAAFLGAGLLAAGAQLPARASDTTALGTVSSTQPLDLTVPVGDLLPATQVSSSSSEFIGTPALFSTSDSTAAPAEEFASDATHFNLLHAMQYGGGGNGRRRYGRPRYRGSNSNADGSEKYTFFGGGGFTVPITDNSNYLTTSYGFQVGAGRNFNRHHRRGSPVRLGQVWPHRPDARQPGQHLQHRHHAV